MNKGDYNSPNPSYFKRGNFLSRSSSYYKRRAGGVISYGKIGKSLL